jgi:hypothetical protein
MAFVFMACSPEAQPPHAIKPPLWYGDESALVLNSYEVVGFGEGNTLVEAQAHAKEMIAQKLLSRVESSFESVSDDAVSKSQAKLKVTSNLDLQDLQTRKQEQKDGGFFVALSFKNLDFAQRVKEKLLDAPCHDVAQNSYLADTPLFKKLNAALGCQRDFSVVRKNRAWYLAHEGELFLLGESELEELYISRQNKAFAFETPKKVLQDKESFYFTLHAQQEGYITLVDVYENGVVTLLEPSKKILKELRIPSKEEAYEFEAGLLEEGRNTHDLYVAFFTKEPLNMSRFTYANEDFAKDENAYKFDELLELMQEHEHATILLRTEAN